jgi:hypothetical protein
MQHIDELDLLYGHPDPGDNVWARCGAIVHEAGDHAARAGLADLFQKSRTFGAYTGPTEAKAFLSECLAALPSTPYLDTQQAAEYLGITIKSLYGQVERGLLEPLRGPRNCYRFTTKMLDDYLR